MPGGHNYEIYTESKEQINLPFWIVFTILFLYCCCSSTNSKNRRVQPKNQQIKTTEDPITQSANTDTKTNSGVDGNVNTIISNNLSQGFVKELNRIDQLSHSDSNKNSTHN